MPRIPQGNFSNNTPNLSRGLPDQRGQRALAEGNQALAQAGESVSNYFKQKEEAEAKEFLTKSYNEISVNESQLLLEEATRGVDYDLSKVRGEFDERIKDYLATAPNDLARQELTKRTDTLFNNKLLSSRMEYQTNRNIQKRENSFRSALDNIRKDTMLGRTDFDEAFLRNEEVMQGMESSLAGVLNMDEERSAANNALTTTYLTAQMTAGNAYDVVEQITNGEWDEYADTITLEKILKSAKRDVVQRGNKDKSLYLSDAKDYINMLKSGKDDPNLAHKYSPELLSESLGEKGERLADEITDARDIGIILQDIKTATPEEVEAMLQERMPKGAKDFTRKSREYNNLVSAYIQIEKERKADPAQYVNNNTKFGQIAYEELQDSFASGDMDLIRESVNKYNAVQVSQQEHVGIDPLDVKLMPKSLVDSFTEKLNDTSKGGAAVSEQINFLKQAYGEQYPRIKAQLLASGNLKKGITVLGDMEFGLDQNMLAEALAFDKKEYKNILDDDDYKGITDEQTGAKASLAAFRGTTNDPIFFGEHREAVEKLAMKFMVDGVEDNYSDALEKALDKVVDSRFEIFDDYRVPKEYNVSNIQYNVKDMIKELKAGNKSLMLPQSNLPDDITRNVYLTKLNPVAHTTQDNKAIVFNHSDGTAILDEEGNPYVVTFEELEKVEQEPSFFDRLFQ